LRFLDCEKDEDTSFDEYWDEVNEHIYSDPAVINELQKKFGRYLGKARTKAPNPRLLDVGSGAGIFLDSARKAGFEATGVEPSSRAVAIASSRYNVPVVCDLLRSDDNLPRDFGVIALWDVIEHVPDPVELLKVCAEHLADNGLLVLETPNEGSLLRQIIRLARSITGKRIDLQNKIYYRAHRYYFTKQAMCMLLERCGYSDIQFFDDHTMFEKSILKQRLYRGFSVGEERLFRIAYWFLRRARPLANKMVVISRKVPIASQ